MIDSGYRNLREEIEQLKSDRDFWKKEAGDLLQKLKERTDVIGELEQEEERLRERNAKLERVVEAARAYYDFCDRFHFGKWEERMEATSRIRAALENLDEA